MKSDKPYIILNLYAGLDKEQKYKFLFLKSQPISDIKDIKHTIQTLQWLNRLLGNLVGKVITVEKYNFKNYSELFEK